MKLLESINSPADLKKLKEKELPKLAEEIREFMLESVSRTGGHLAPSLGTVELAIALHYCYDTPSDKLVWDVGHQAYAHKILTGRREQFHTLRQYKGISGFPHVTESEYDALTVGHASTSISAALGMAKARDLKKETHSITAIIGDGSLSGGLAFEGLNNLGTDSTAMTVILNDNEMSIAKNVGALHKYLTTIITDKRYNKIKNDLWQLLGHMSNVGKTIRNAVHNVDDAIKKVITPGKFFEDMGLRYIGPVDGHNLNELIKVFKYTKNSANEPVLVHIITKKGKGYRFAEDNATKYHGIGSFSRNTGDVESAGSSTPSYSDVFGTALCDLAEKDEKIVAITAAMPDGTGLQHFRDKFPERLFDVGIAEGHAVTFSAGLALSGIKPVVAIYSTFLQRAYDNIIHDVALEKLNVVFCLDRAGIVGADGPTHHGTFDLSYLRSIPNATIMAPADEYELRNMIYSAINCIDGPVFIRYPRGKGRGLEGKSEFKKIEGCKPEVMVEGKDVAIIAIGDMVIRAEKISEILKDRGIEAAVINARFAKPLDNDYYQNFFKKYSRVYTLESNALRGGFGSAILEVASEVDHKNSDLSITTLGYPDMFINQGGIEQLLDDIGLSPQKVAERIIADLK